MMRERKTRSDKPTEPLSEVASLSTATDEAEGKEEAAPSEMPSARAWKSSPMNVENAGDLESSGSSTILSLNLLLLVLVAATVKYSP